MSEQALCLAINEGGISAFLIIVAVASCAAVTGAAAMLIFGRWNPLAGLRGAWQSMPQMPRARLRLPSAAIIASAVGLSLLASSVALQAMILVKLNSKKDISVVLDGISTSDQMAVSIQGVSTSDELPVSLQSVSPVAEVPVAINAVNTADDLSVKVSGTPSVEVENTSAIKVDIDDHTIITPLPVRVVR